MPAAGGATCVVLCVGDVGRSPRMQYHAMSLAADRGVKRVHLVGLAGSECFPEVTASGRVQLHLLQPPAWLQSTLLQRFFLLRSALRVLWQTVALLLTLMFGTPAPDVLLVQNPPAVPSLPLAWAVARLRGARLVIDWHNFGYSLLALNRGGDHNWLVRAYRSCETFFGRRADAHLCVTQGMQNELASDDWRIRQASVLYDKPPRHFRSTSLEERHELFTRLLPELQEALQPWPSSEHDFGSAADVHNTTLFTLRPVLKQRSADVQLRPDRPALVVSSTSWTPDENFTILLEALEEYDKKARRPGGRRCARVVLLVTGKGPERARFEKDMNVLNRRLRFVRAATIWLAPEDYPRLLGSADLGISLHASSSGFDLPMKVVDMFGCEIPVCALFFPCLNELVKDGKNGLVFRDSKQLARQLLDLLADWPTSRRLQEIKSFVQTQQLQPAAHWEANWRQIARPLLLC
eukprot:TRINITY_DN9884_c0_g1_i3.p1 TRINITY_DN9884_c0_g1~~TRINITY_DN9884_c0_g1_i3.p1  ORF type:complete len:498 (+),score=55.80 TRINITY_DN9884_c0_g1_i3:103-1494(+)